MDTDARTVTAMELANGGLAICAVFDESGEITSGLLPGLSISVGGIFARV